MDSLVVSPQLQQNRSKILVLAVLRCRATGGGGMRAWLQLARTHAAERDLPSPCRVHHSVRGWLAGSLSKNLPAAPPPSRSGSTGRCARRPSDDGEEEQEEEEEEEEEEEGRGGG
eukprot:gene10662-biopygen1777